LIQSRNINISVDENQVLVYYLWFPEKIKGINGINFNKYLKHLHLEEAECLLVKGWYTVYEIGERVCSSDVKYFMKTVRASTGMSPTEWKNKHQEK